MGRFTHIFFDPVPRWGAYSAPQMPNWSARLRHSHIKNLTRSASTVSPSTDSSAVERWRRLTRKLQRKHRIWRNATLLIHFSEKTKDNRTQKAVQRSRIGNMYVHKNRRDDRCRIASTARNSSNFEDRFVRTAFEDRAAIVV